MTATPWDDDRLDAAFGEMAAMHPVPAGLVSTTLAVIATPTPRPSLWRVLMSPSP